ncbi:MAG: HD domain-containing protein [Candidatus Aenigmatarchaeota archaeon]
MNSVEKVREFVKKECSEDDWKYHVSIVIDYSRILAEKLGADKEIVELGSILHDIGWIRDINDDPIHDTVGQKHAEEILKEFGFSEDTINKVNHCIESHRVRIIPITLEAKIIANADAMSHFDSMPYLLKIALKNSNGNIKESVQWLYDKLENDWKKKITLPEAREMIEEKYKAAKRILESIS